MANEGLEALKKQVEGLNKEIGKIEGVDQKEIEKIADLLHGKSSSWLAAAVGAIAGATAGVSIPLALAAAPVALAAGPLAAVAGGALAVLAWRGRKYQQIERETEKFKLVLDAIRGQIEGLGPETPARVKEKLWDNYLSISDQGHATVRELLADKTRDYQSIGTVDEQTDAARARAAATAQKAEGKSM